MQSARGVGEGNVLQRICPTGSHRAITYIFDGDLTSHLQSYLYVSQESQTSPIWVIIARKMEAVQLPLDVIINIFLLLPLRRDREESSVSVLVHCAFVSKLWNEAATQSLVWKDHYHTRYEHCFEEREFVRTCLCNNDYRAMYVYRRHLDNNALERLNEMVISKATRMNIASLLADHGMDLFDVFELEATRPLPSPFQGEEETEHFEGAKLPSHALARRYWAKAMLETITRGNGISSIWRRFWRAPTPQERPSFEETMTSLSTFFGCSAKRIRKQLEDLWDECRRVFIHKGIDFDTESCDLRELSKQICIFMHTKGFKRVSHPRILEQGETDLFNKFPHAYLTTHKTTLPISLCHIFAAIATRFGVETNPVNFPGIVMMHVLVPPRNEYEPEDTFLVNPFASDPNFAVIGPDSPPRHNPPLQMASILQTVPNIAEYLKPCEASLMLIRACANISTTFESLREYGRPEVRPSAILAVCVHLLFGEHHEHLNSLLSVGSLRPIDTVVLQKQLAPLLQSANQEALRAICQATLRQDAELSRVRTRGPDQPMHFVGMAFIHRRLGYKGFVTGWDETCTASESWITSMQIDSLAGGREQPFYRIYATDGSQRYVAEEHLEPAHFSTDDLKILHREFTDLPLMFEGAEFGDTRGRLLLSPDSMRIYPDDDRYGSDWIALGDAVQDSFEPHY